MRILFSSVEDRGTYPLKVDIKRLNSLNHSKNIICFDSVEGEVYAERLDQVIELAFRAKVSVEAVSSYTLKPFVYKMKIDEKLLYSNDPGLDSDDVIYIDSEVIDIEEIIYSLVLTSLPLDIHAPGEKLASGDGYEVYSEDEIKKDISDNPFASIDLDDLK
jgi:uncharacterized metal-binding protein YceD (DUF177 family)